MKKIIFSLAIFAGSFTLAGETVIKDNSVSNQVNYSSFLVNKLISDSNDCADFGASMVQIFEDANNSLSSNELVEIGAFFEAWCNFGFSF